jgi:hypothetical protein
LPTGKVLIAGGQDDGGGLLSTAELYDPEGSIFTPTGTMTTGRTGHAATLLPKGQVLITGGSVDDGWTSLASAELYDPASGAFTATAPMIAARQLHTATLLPSGEVLVAGGQGSRHPDANALASAELYDPTSGTFTATGSLATARQDHSATLLPSGKVLIAGGMPYSGIGAFASAELYDPASGTFMSAGAMTAARYSHTATLLPNGKVLIVGGGDHANYADESSSAEQYDSAMGDFTATGTMTIPRLGHTATLLPSGKVLVAGGGSAAGVVSSAEIYY